MSVTNRKFATLAIGLLIVCSSHARANYIVSVEDENGLHSAPLIPGATYNLNVVLSGTSTHESSDFTVTVSEPNLVLSNFDWGFPYHTGISDDISVPQITDLPVVLTADTWDNTPAIDARFSNFLSIGNFSVGTILNIDLVLPSDIPMTTVIEISVGGNFPNVIPVFNDSFSAAPIDGIQSFFIGVPEPATISLFLIVGATVWRQRSGRHLKKTICIGRS